jgi:hypothetical protein
VSEKVGEFNSPNLQVSNPPIVPSTQNAGQAGRAQRESAMVRLAIGKSAIVQSAIVRSPITDSTISTARRSSI